MRTPEHRTHIRQFLFPILCLILLLSFPGCSETTTPSESITKETGSVAFNVVLEKKEVKNKDAVSPFQAGMRDMCGGGEFEISMVAARIYSTPQVDGSWACTAGSGTLNEVPVGNHLLRVIGYNASEYDSKTLYCGETYVNVVAGQTATPTITAEAFSVDKTYPQEDASGINPGSINFQWNAVTGATGYVLQVSDSEDFIYDNLVVNEETASTSFTPSYAFNENTTYYWAVFPVDYYGDSAYDNIWSFNTGSSGTVTDDNYEENDTLLSATDISGYEQTSLSNINGLGIANYGDDDWYQIEVSPGAESLVIDCYFTHANGDVDIQLYSADEFIAGSYGIVDNEHLEIDFSGREPGAYFIQVYLTSGESNSYDLVWDDIGGDDNYEENDTLDAAYNISIYEGTYLSDINGLGIANYGDYDWYQIEVKSGTTDLIIDCLFTDADGDVDIELYSADEFIAGSYGVVDNEHLEIDFSGREPGAYFIKVYLASGESNTYNLWWDDITGDDNYEENDSIAEAYDLSYLYGYYLSEINGLGMAVLDDDDYYAIEVSYYDANIEIECSFSDDLGDIDILLLDADGEVMEGSASTTDNEILSFEHHSDSLYTTYYIKVYLFDDGSGTLNNQYDLIHTITQITSTVNLTAYQSSLNESFSISPTDTVWGSTLNVNWAVINDGTTAIPSGTDVYLRFYLSENYTISTADTWLGDIQLQYLYDYGLESNTYIYNTSPDTFTLPASPPDGFLESGTFYVGMIIDADNGLEELYENDNANTGEGLDYGSISISSGGGGY